ncbi:MAG: PKD domain-containing protein [Bacteroidales bacterium]|nr:PKD domain-containing protein [Bacteroidales bacterium]
MKKTVYLFLILLNITTFVMAQCGGVILTVNNPSFEGTPEPHVTPPGWDICMPGNTPDTQPGSWGINLPPYEGSSYIGLVWGGSSWVEGASQTLSSPMVAGTTYEFTLALATTASTGGGILPGCVELQIWGNMGGNSGCDHSELLWSSGDVFDAAHMDQWVVHTVSFTPSQNWGHLLFSVYNLGCSDQPYIMLDDLSAIVPITDIAEFSWTGSGSNNAACTGQAVTFHDESTSAQSTITNWSWNFNDGTTSTAQNPVHTFASPGTYDVSLTIISAIPCTTNVIHQVIVYETPIATVSGGGSICPGTGATAPVTITLTGTPPWSITYFDGVNSTTVNGINTTPYIINTPVTGNYTVTAVSDANCTGTSSGNASVAYNNLPLVTFAVLPHVCVNFAPFQLTGGGPAGGNYSGPGVNGNMFDPALAGVGTHQITYTYTDPNTGCTDSAHQAQLVLAGINIGVDPPLTYICPEGHAVLVATGADTYQWTPSDGLTQDYGPIVIAMPETSTTYTVFGTNSVGCTGTNTVQVNIYNTEMVNIFVSPNEGCSPHWVNTDIFPEEMIEDSTWLWNFGDIHGPGNVSYQQNPSHVYGGEGYYMVTFAAMDTNGCHIKDTAYVRVYPTPVANFYTNPDIGYAGITNMQFIDISLNANAWYWEFGDPGSYNYNYSNEQHPHHTFADSGTYSVMLVATSTYNCRDTIIKDVLIFPEFVIFIPNAFTPNRDHINDVFKPSIIGFDRESYRFYIFDRWGKMIFFSSNIENGWDGKINGKEAAEGIYSFLLYVNENTGKDHKVKGIVTLIR